MVVPTSFGLFTQSGDSGPVLAANSLTKPAKPGDYVRQGQSILELRADDPARFASALEALETADVITIGNEAPPYVPLVVDDVGA